MKILVTVIFAILIMESCSNRECIQREIDFNSGWQCKSEKCDSINSELEPQNDNWIEVVLPHYMSVEDNNSDVRWYKKNFVTNLTEPQKLYVLFEKISDNSTVWVNNQKVGEHSCSLAPFYFDITNYLKAQGGTNEMIVKINAGERVGNNMELQNGVFSRVKLVKVNKLHIPIWGTEITTPHVSHQSANVSIKIDLINSYNEHKTCDIVTEIYNPENKLVEIIASQSSFVKIGNSVIEQRGRVLKPQLWDIDSPNLYRAKVKIFHNKELVDSYETKFGIRNIEFDKKETLILNDKRVIIKCFDAEVNKKHLEFSIQNYDWKNQLVLLKQQGYNAVKITNTTGINEFLDYCDENGFLVTGGFWGESISNDEGKISGNTRLSKHMYCEESELKSILLVQRNHPSILFPE